MSKVIVVTDSNSGITPDEAKKLGVEVIPMPFYIDEQMYYENIDLTQEQFYERLTARESSESQKKQISMRSLREAYGRRRYQDIYAFGW